MSGKPNPDGVKKLRQAMRDYAWTRDKIRELKLSINEQQKALELREVELRGLNALIQGTMADMDVSAPGNNGYEQRHFEMLLMMAELG